MTKLTWFIVAYVVCDVLLDVANEVRINRLNNAIDNLQRELDAIKKAQESHT